MPPSFDPPPADAYVEALQSLADTVPAPVRRMLRAQREAPDRTATAGELAHAAGYAKRGAANLHYGALGKRLADAFGLAVPGDKGWPVLSSGSDTPDGFLWTMRPEVAGALDQLGWADEPGFLDELQALCDEGVVFESDVQRQRYAVSEVDDAGALVDRLSATQPVRVTEAGYQRALDTVRAAGGRMPERDIDRTVTLRATYLLGPHLAPDGEGHAVALSDPLDSAQLLARFAGALRVDGGEEPKVYKPAALAAAVEAIESGDLTENRIPFDWLAPRLAAVAARHGQTAGPEQAALAFFHLSREPFWLLAYRDPASAPDAARTPAAIRKHVHHARLRRPFWDALQTPEGRRVVLDALRDAWWPGASPAASIVLDRAVLARAVDQAIRPLLVGDDLLAEGAAEGYQHHKVLPRVRPLLTWASIEADPVAALDGALSASANLLSSFQKMKALTLVRDADPDEVREHALDLLHGDDPLEDRVDRFVARRLPPAANGGHRTVDATVASYLLAASDPERYAFCKPTVYAAAARALLGAVPDLGPTGARVAHCTAFYRAVLDALCDDHGLPVSDLLHVHIALYAVTAYDSVPGWDALAADPPRVVKVAPGHDASQWDDCLAGGYVCVGWDEVGDLGDYDHFDDFRAAFAEHHAYDGHAPTQTKKARELWTLRELAPGDLVVANRGTSEVLAVGTVQAPGYVWRPDRDGYRHTVAVEWDTDYAQTVPTQRYWALVTVDDIDADLAALILTELRDPDPDELWRVLDEPAGRVLLDRTNVVLYGPPGTGKTRASLRIADAWQAWQGPGTVEQVTFHPSYAYEDFVEGFRPDPDPDAGGFACRPGLFVQLADRARVQPDRRFLLLIDEVNRGDAARVFGELVTLLEPDKRGPHAQRRLPSSGRHFWVPPNVYLLGTMNTADRSVSLLDVAVRRRFAFVETPPDPSVLDAAPIPSVVGVALSAVLRGLNARLAQAGLDPDQAVGHSYFLLAPDAQAPDDLVEHLGLREAVAPAHADPARQLLDRLRYDVVPLVLEYVHADRARAAEVLGPLVGDDGRLDPAIDGDPDRLAAALGTLARG